MTPCRIKIYEAFKQFKLRFLVSTDIFSRGIDIEKINIVFNYDMPDNSDSYLHRVGRAGRFGTKGLAISFVSGDDDKKVLEDVQKRFEVKIGELPTTIDSASYSKSTTPLIFASSEQLSSKALGTAKKLRNEIKQLSLNLRARPKLRSTYLCYFSN